MSHANGHACQETLSEPRSSNMKMRLLLPGRVPGFKRTDVLLFGVFIQLPWKPKVKNLLGTQSSLNFGMSSLHM